MQNLLCGLTLAMALGAVAGPLALEEDAETGGLVSVKIAGDAAEMNWIRRADGKEFAWIGPNYRWGTGTPTTRSGRSSTICGSSRHAKCFDRRRTRRWQSLSVAF